MKTNILISIFFLTMGLLVFSCNTSEPPIPEIFPKEIISVQITQGVLSGSDEIPKQNLLIKTQAEWEDLMNTMDSDNNLTEIYIDFSSFQVIAVFDKARANDEWSIDITDITEYADSIVVTIQNNLKSGSDSEIIIQPYQIVKIPISDKKIVFIDNTFPKEIPFTEIAQRTWSQSIVNVTANEKRIIRTQEEWRKFKESLCYMPIGYEELVCETGGFHYTEVNFNTYQLLVVVDSVRPTIGYSIQIVAMTAYSDNIVVIVHQYLPRNPIIQYISKPFQIVETPILDGEFLFEFRQFDRGW